MVLLDAFELSGTLVSFSCLWTHTETADLHLSGACSPLDKGLPVSSSGTQFLSSDEATLLGASLQDCNLLQILLALLQGQL